MEKLLTYVQWIWFVFVFLGLPTMLLGNLFYGTHNISIGVIIFSVIAVFLSSFWNVFKRHKEFFVLPQLGKMLSSVIVGILAYANLYRFEGLISPNGEVVYSASDALYFSIVTWTTLGYGDFQPSESVRIYASSEALLGTMFIPLVIAALISILSINKNA